MVCDEDDEGTYAVTRIRKLGALALAAPLAVGFVAFGPGTAARAEGSGIKRPANKAVITEGSTTTVTAHLDLLAVGRLFVDGPGSGGERQIASGTGPRDISDTISISRNGVYVVTLKGLLGGTIDRQTFSVRVPPARPSGVDAGLSGSKLVVRWEAGSESDLTGYDVFVGGNRARRGSTGALCAVDVCSTALSVPSSGRRAEVGVRARRPDGRGGTVASQMSTDSVLLPVSTPPGRRGTRGVDGLPPRSANPLLPLAGRSPLTLPTVAPDGATPGFQYPTPAPQVATPPTAGPNASNASSADLARWGKSVASALILLVVAAHLGMWTRRMRLAQAAAESAGAIPDAGRRGRTKRERRTRADEPVKVHAAEAATATSPSGGAAPAAPARPAPVRPASGPLIDAKGPMANAAFLGAGKSSARSTPEPADDAATAGAVPTPAAGAVPGPRAAAQDVTAHTQHAKAKRSARHSAGYRGRRRAD